MNQICPCGCNASKIANIIKQCHLVSVIKNTLCEGETMNVGQFVGIAQSGTYFRDGITQPIANKCSDTGNNKSSKNDPEFGKFIACAQTGTWFK